MGRRKLSEEEKRISREKRLQYLKNYRQKHGSDYYKKNKEIILKKQRQKRELEKGSPLNKYTKGVNIKNMSRKEYNEYCKFKTREYRIRQKYQQSPQFYLNIIKKMAIDILAIGGWDFIDYGLTGGNLKEDVDKVMNYYLKHANDKIYE